MGTPSPWDSHPLGDLVVERYGTYLARFRQSIHLLSRLIVGSSAAELQNPCTTDLAQTDAARNRCRGGIEYFHVRLDFGQSSSCHVARVLQDDGSAISPALLLYQYAKLTVSLSG